MNGSFSPAADLLTQLQRLQRHFDPGFPGFNDDSIRATPVTFPVLNVGRSSDALEVMAMAPGVDPASIDLSIDKGLLIISGERKTSPTGDREGTATYANERFSGRFRRVISLPDDVDPAKVQATMRDGVLRVTLAKRESSKPRRIEIS